MPSLRSAIYYQFTRYTLRRLRKKNLTLSELRSNRDQIARRMFRMPEGVAVRAEAGLSFPAEWLLPDDASADGPAILYLHGGAYQSGSLDTHRVLAARIASAAKLATLTVAYRLAPESPFPAALDDALEAYRFLVKGGRRVALAGDSAGGGLALALSANLRDKGEEPPFALALMSPWTDLAMTGATVRTKASVDPYFPTGDILEMAAASYAGSAPLENPLISPLHADLRGLPPTLIHVGTREVLLDDSLRIAERARQAGVDVTLKEWPAMWHVWQILGGRMPEADRSIAELGAFLRAKAS